jgi:hypothetical protein
MFGSRRVARRTAHGATHRTTGGPQALTTTTRPDGPVGWLSRGWRDCRRREERWGWPAAVLRPPEVGRVAGDG